MMTESDIRRNVERVRENLRQASHRFRHDVQLCAVTKTVAPEVVNMCHAAGIRIIGENRVQEAVQKLSALNPDFKLHIIGQLQTNKVKYIIECADMVQSLDRIELARELSRRAQAKGRVMPVLAQVNIAEEPQKAGVYESVLPDFLRECAGLSGIRISGLMAIMPFVQDPEEVRPYFRRMREWFERLRDEPTPGVHMDVLSMGMSGDYIVAAQEGATMVRVGSSIFGSR